MLQSEKIRKTEQTNEKTVQKLSTKKQIEGVFLVSFFTSPTTKICKYQPRFTAEMGKKIVTVKCPEVSLPEDFKKPRRDFGDSRRSDEERKPFGFGDKGKRKVSIPGTERSETMSTKEELGEYMKNIKEFNANSELGTKRRKFEEDKLTKLGALPLKQVKMPLKVKLRVLEAKNKREKRRLDELKQSHEVVANNLMPKKKKARK